MICVTTKNSNEFELTDIAFLEHKFYLMAKEAGSYKVENGQQPSDGNASNSLDEVLSFTKKCLNILGYDLFDKASFLTEYSVGENVKDSGKKKMGGKRGIQRILLQKKETLGEPVYKVSGSAFNNLINMRKGKGEYFGNLIKNLGISVAYEKVSCYCLNGRYGYYWLEPETAVLEKDWLLGLVDPRTKEVTLFLIPANTFSKTQKAENSLKLRKDDPDNLEIKILPKNYLEQYSKKSFLPFMILKFKIEIV